MTRFTLTTAAALMLGTAAFAGSYDKDADTAKVMKDSAGTEAATTMPKEDINTASASDRPLLTAPEVERDGFETAVVSQISAEELNGTYVYGPDDETVGEVGDLLLTDDGKVEHAIINVGGFLGLGEKPVAVTMDELTLLENSEGELRVYIDNSQEVLEQLPTYEG